MMLVLEKLREILWDQKLLVLNLYKSPTSTAQETALGSLTWYILIHRDRGGSVAHSVRL
jgi:hypothetical protein